MKITKLFFKLPAGTSRDISEWVRAETKLNEKNQQLRMLSSYLQSVREDERTHIAREIHDELGQQLTGIKMDLSWIYKKFEIQNPDISKKLHEVTPPDPNYISRKYAMLNSTVWEQRITKYITPSTC